MPDINFGNFVHKGNVVNVVRKKTNFTVDRSYCIDDRVFLKQTSTGKILLSVKDHIDSTSESTAELSDIDLKEIVSYGSILLDRRTQKPV